MNEAVQLVTYGPYIPEGDVQYERIFSVPRQWLENYIQEDWGTIEEFLGEYTWDTTLDTYAQAVQDGVLLEVVVV